MTSPHPESHLFSRGTIVVITLNNPREKFWGVILELNPSGVSVRGIDLNSFDDFADMVRSGEPTVPGAVFFPMHRVERLEIDAPSGSIPSLAGRFAARTGTQAATILAWGEGERR
jgi:hypothetical protein